MSLFIFMPQALAAMLSTLSSMDGIRITEEDNYVYVYDSLTDEMLVLNVNDSDEENQIKINAFEEAAKQARCTTCQTN